MDEETKDSEPKAKGQFLDSATGLTMTMIENYMDAHMNDYASFDNIETV